MEIQQAVYALELGAGARWTRRGVLVVVILALAFLFDMRHFRGFGSLEEMDVAQVARNIAQGKGFTTDFIRPLALAEQQDHAYRSAPHSTALEDRSPAEKRDLSAFPDTFNPPLYPVVLAGIFKIAGVDFSIPPVDKFHIYAPEYCIVVFNELCVLFSAWLVFTLAIALFDERVAWVSLGIFLLGNLVWQFGASGTPVSFTMLLLLGVFHLLQRALLAEEEQEPGKTWLWLLLGALLLGAASLCSYGAAWLFIPYLAVVLCAFQRRWLMALAVVAIWLALLVPWGVRNYSISGDPLGGYAEMIGENGASYPGTSLSRTYRYKPGVLLWEEGLRKILPGLGTQLDSGFGLLGASLVTLFCVAGFLHFFKRRRAQILRYFTFGGFLVLAFGATFVQDIPINPAAGSNYLFLVWPLVVIFGTAFFFILVDRIPFPAVWVRTGAILFFIALNAFPLAITLLRNTALFRYPPYFPPVIVFVSNWFEPDELLVSDIPWAVAWYGQKTSLWVPATIKEYLEINDFVHPINGIFLTPESRNSPALYSLEKGEWKEWVDALRGRSIPPGLGLNSATLLPPDANDCLMIADHVRWAPQAQSNDKSSGSPRK